MNPKTRHDEEFFPKGAIAFFFALSGMYVGLWLWIYIVMIRRG